MKSITVTLLIAFLVLSACSSTQSPSGREGTQNQLSSTELPTPTSNIDNGEGVGMTFDPGQPTPPPIPQASVQPGPSVDWDHSPETLIISTTNCCGFAPDMVKLNYIPEAQVWGGGRIVWTQMDSSNQRQILEGKLTQDQMAEFLKTAVNQGFFQWDELYTSPMSPTDLPSKCLFIHLESQSRKVCEYYKGAPQAFHDLYDRLSKGNGVEGQPYQPEKGYLVAYPTPGPDQAAEQQAVPEWNSNEFGLSLSKAENGAWIEGPALETAWELLNAKPWGTVVQENGSYYLVSLQIPGLSLTEPPAQ